MQKGGKSTCSRWEDPLEQPNNLIIWVFHGVSINGSTPKSSILIHFNGIFPYKPSILGYPHLWNPPYWNWIKMCKDVSILNTDSSLSWSLTYRSQGACGHLARAPLLKVPRHVSNSNTSSWFVDYMIHDTPKYYTISCIYLSNVVTCCDQSVSACYNSGLCFFCRIRPAVCS